MKKKLFVWSDFLVPTGFGQVAHNLLDTMHEDFDVQILGINYHGDKRYDTSKYFVYPVSKDDLVGMKKLPFLLQRENPDIIFLFQDIFHISDVIDKIRTVCPLSKIVSYFPVDGAPFSAGWSNVLTTSNAVIAYSDWAIKVINDRFPNTNRPITKLYHGVDTSLYYPLAEDRIADLRANFGWYDKFAVININRFQPRKAIPLGLRAFSMFAKGYKVCKCGNHMPIDRTSCDLNMCPPEDIIEVKEHNRRDVYLYLHMMAQEPCMGPGRANLLQNHLINAGFVDDDVNNIIGINAANIYGGAVSNNEINEFYNAANLNISSTHGEGKLLEGTLVLTSTGYDYIENIGEKAHVANDVGKFTKVNKTLATEFTSPMFSIKLDKTPEPFFISEDHPIKIENSDYVRADQVKIGDKAIFVLPNFTGLKLQTEIDLLTYNDNVAFTDKYFILNKKRFPRKIKITENLCKFLGMYVACGTCGDKLVFQFYSDEIKTNYVDFIYTTYDEVFNTYKDFDIERSKHPKEVELPGERLRNFLHSNFGKDSKSKKIPLWLFNQPEEYRQAFIEGLMLGNKTYRLVTPSVFLIYGYRDLWITLGKLANLNKISNYYEATSFKKLETDTNQIALEIKIIETVKAHGIGHDLEVPEGESYTIAQCTVHNCGLSLLESAATGTPSIAPKNSAIPEMLRNTGQLIPNVGIVNHAMDNGHLRPVVDPWLFSQGIEKEYLKWKESGKQKIIDINCVDNIKKNFLWKDKVDILRKIFIQLTASL